MATTRKKAAGQDRVGGPESVLAAIAALPEARIKRAPGLIPVSSDFRSGAYGVVLDGAKFRRMSVAAYMRRSAYAMGCFDMNVPIADILSIDDRVTRETGFAVKDPDGTKFGSWEIEGLVLP